MIIILNQNQIYVGIIFKILLIIILFYILLVNRVNICTTSNTAFIYLYTPIYYIKIYFWSRNNGPITAKDTKWSMLR